MSRKRPGIKGKSRRRLDKAHARYEQLARKRRDAAVFRAAAKRQADFESAPTSVDYDNDCAP